MRCQEFFLSGLTITNRPTEQLIKDFHISICNICNRTPNCVYIHTANITLNEVCRNFAHLGQR